MRITLTELQAMADPAIDLLEIVSIEGHQYMASLHISGETYILSDDHGKTLLSPGSWALQDLLAGFPIKAAEMVHPSAYNEMVGMPSGPVEPMRVPIQKAKP